MDSWILKGFSRVQVGAQVIEIQAPLDAEHEVLERDITFQIERVEQTLLPSR